MGGFDFGSAFGGNGSAYDLSTSVSAKSGIGGNTLYKSGGGTSSAPLLIIGGVIIFIVILFFLMGKK
jgi:hypothetical protein